MENDKWYINILLILIIVMLLPAILIGTAWYWLFKKPIDKKKYENTPYYKQFKEKFSNGIVNSAEYRFYNSVMHRSLPIDYQRVSNELGHFVYNNTLFLLSYYDQIEWDEENSKWLIGYDGDFLDCDNEFSQMLGKIQNPDDLPIKLLVERRMVTVDDLTDTPLPDDIYVTWSYDDAFEYDDNPFMTKLPTTTAELYEQMLKIPDLCGELELDGELIKWRLYDGYLVELSLDEGSGYMSVNRKTGITHWHPVSFELCDTVLKMTSRGNVLVIRSRLFSSKTLYCGKKADCPYSPEQKPFLGKMYFLETV